MNRREPQLVLKPCSPPPLAGKSARNLAIAVVAFVPMAGIFAGQYTHVVEIVNSEHAWFRGVCRERSHVNDVPATVKTTSPASQVVFDALNVAHQLAGRPGCATIWLTSYALAACSDGLALKAPAPDIRL